jgi:hypothetical protein
MRPSPIATSSRSARAAHGVNLHLAPADLIRLLDADVVAVTRPAS